MFDTVKYNEELEYIFNQFPSYQQVGKVAYKPGIETMTDFDKQLGYPHKKYATIHIAGTNGKGSTVNALQTIFTRAGYEVGTFTSPYIIDFKERISLNGQMISEEDLLDLVNRVKPVVERLPKETEHEKREDL